MTKFNVGDKVRFIENHGEYSIGDEVTITYLIRDEHVKFKGQHGIGDVYTKRIELVEPKQSNKKRITALEKEVAELLPLKEEVAELKLIVHELRDRPQLTTVVNNISEPSTIVEDIIEFEGAKYRKVDRKAREGDVIVFNSKMHPNNAKPNKPYIVNRETPHGLGHHDGATLCDVKFVIYDNGRSTETVDVYELINCAQAPTPESIAEWECKPKSPNEQRARIIEDAKKFVDENSEGTDIVVNDEHQAITAIYYDGKDVKKNSALCHPNDVFNEHIGKAIALGRALNIDVSQFEQAVQPTLAIGQIVYETEDDEYREIAPSGIYSKESMKSSIDSHSAKELSKIINDTNAQYGGVEIEG